MKRNSSALGRLAGLFRVQLYFLALVAVFGGVVARQALGQVEHAAERVGRQLMALGDVVGPPELLDINGQSMFLASKQVDLPLEQVLDRFEGHCRKGSAKLAEEVQKLPGFAAHAGKLPERLRDPTGLALERTEDDEGGTFACLAQPPGDGILALAGRVNQFVSTGDLSQLGNMRYVFARRLPGNRTHVVAVWTEGAFRILSMFPPSGDAPGRDSPHVPRPPDAERWISAEARTRPYAARLYVTKQSPREVLAFYDRAMAKRGWQSTPVSFDADDATSKAARSFVKDGAGVYVVTGTDEDGTNVTLLELGTRGVVITGQGR